MDRVTNDAPPTSPPRKRRKWWRALGGIALLMVLALLLAPKVAEPFIRRKLEAMVADHLYASLQIGSLSYKFPYGVTVNDVSFVTDATHGSLELLSVKQMDLTLAEIPLGSGPIIIERLTIDSPVVRAVRKEDRKFIGTDLARKEHDRPANPQRQIKLSDILRLREFQLSDAKFIYEDRSQPDVKPLEWRNLTAHLALAAKSASLYGFEFAAQSKPIAQLAISGDADVDALTVNVAKLSMDVAVGSDQSTSPLPAELQRLVNTLGVQGKVRFDVTGNVPLKNPQAGRFKLDATLSDLSLRPRDQPWSLQHLSFNFAAERGMERAPSSGASPAPQMVNSDAAPITMRLSHFHADAMGAQLHLSEVHALIDFESKRWALGELAGKLDAGMTAPEITERGVVGNVLLAGGVQIQGSAGGSIADRKEPIDRGDFVITLDHLTLAPPHFPHKLVDLVGVIRMQNDMVVVQNISVNYGDDRFELNQAIVSLSELPQRVEARDIYGSAAFSPPGSKYPPPLDEMMKQVRPGGLWELRGTAALYRGRGKLEPDYALTITPKLSSAWLTEKLIYVTNLKGDIAVAPRLIEVNYLEGSAFNGNVAVSGSLVPRSPFEYNGEVIADNADLAEVSRTFEFYKETGGPRLTGRGRARVTASGKLRNAAGKIAPLESLVARGRARVTDGNFWSLKIINMLVGEIRLAREALTVGEAAAIFEVRNQRIIVRKAVISAPALGLQGTGSVGFNGALDLDIIAAPLGDWRKKLRSTGIPIFSDVAGHIAGGLQKLVNSATSNLLYQFRVKGTTGDPKVFAVPAPLLTNSAARLFGVMLGGGKSEKLEEMVEEQVAAPATQPSTDAGD